MAKMVTFIAGMNFRPGAAERLKVLPKNQPLELRREADNKFDSNAVAVYHGPTHLGYIPAVDARSVAAAIDRGLTATATLSRVSASTEITVSWDSGAPS